MSVAAIMLVKDEADIVEHTIRHLIENVDQIFVSDNLSSDGTSETLTKLARFNHQVVVSEDTNPAHYQGKKMTRLARVAYNAGHRWVLCCDADEIWYAPDGRPIRDWLDGIGREIQMVKATIYNHVATAQDDPDDTNPVTRIRWRQRTPLEIKWGKIAARTRPDLKIGEGNHHATTSGTGTIAYGLELRHFPYRSPEQFVRKARNGYAALTAATDLNEDVGAHWRAYGKAIEEGGDAAGHARYYDWFYSADPEADDTLILDPAPQSQ